MLVVAKICDITKLIQIPDTLEVGNFETDAEAEGNNECCCVLITVSLLARGLSLEVEISCLKTSSVSLFASIFFLIRIVSATGDRLRTEQNRTEQSFIDKYYSGHTT